MRPQWDLPFRVERDRYGNARIPTVDQDSTRAIGNCVELAVRYEQGDRRTLPSFGRPRVLAFTTDREMARVQIQQTIDDWEPRVRSIVRNAPLDPDDPGLLRILAMYEGA